MKLRLTKQFTFEMAHALPLYPGKCHNIHGHSYKLQVTIEGTEEPSLGAGSGMVMDFSSLKKIVEEHIVSPFDHALALPLPEGNTAPPADSLGNFSAKIIWLPFQPTSENLLLHFAQQLSGKLPAGTRLHSIKLYETENSCAELIL